MASNDFNTTVSTLFNGMDSFLTTKTVVGEPTKIGDTIILPLVDVAFGVGVSKCRTGYSGRTYQAGKHQESGQHHQDSGYGTGAGR